MQSKIEHKEEMLRKLNEKRKEISAKRRILRDNIILKKTQVINNKRVRVYKANQTIENYA